MTREVNVYKMTASEAAECGADWDYETEELNGPGWYWDSFIEGVPVVRLDGPYSTRERACMAAGVSP